MASQGDIHTAASVIRCAVLVRLNWKRLIYLEYGRTGPLTVLRSTKGSLDGNWFVARSASARRCQTTDNQAEMGLPESEEYRVRASRSEKT
jgi:hypothetical protein